MVHGIESHRTPPQCSRPGCQAASRQRCCSNAAYCSVLCHKGHWPVHAAHCEEKHK